MDLTIQLKNTKLNIRVAVLLETSEGYIFEQNKEGYFFILGGRVKAGESSLEAAKREVLEEINFEIKNLKLVGIIENFFDQNESRVQEICFVYKCENVINTDLPENFIQLSKEELANKDIRPEIIKKIISDKQGVNFHYIVN